MMNKRKIVGFLLLSCLVCGLTTGCSDKGGTEKEQPEAASQDTQELPSAQRDIFAMDTYMTVTAYGEKAEEAVEAAEQEINRLDQLLSVSSSESEVYIVNENGSEILSEDTAVLVEKSLELYESTEGMFDITVYPLMEEWGFTTEQYRIPEKKRLKELLRCVDASQIQYKPSECLLTLPEGVEIDLGGIAKGYTSGRIMAIFEKYGIQSGIVSLGGNVQLYGAKADGSPWKVAIQNPDTSTDAADYIGILEIKDKAVITSGGYERYFEQDGKTYHHILDPDTGYPAESGLTSVTIVSEDGTLADGLSTSLFIMGKKKALEYWRAHADSFDVILVEEDGTITLSEGIQDEFSSDYDVHVEYQ